MDFLNKVTGSDKNEEQQKTEGQKSEGGFMDKLNTMAGGGRESEKKEDALDKGIDWVQENVLKQGPQDNESAVEQAKDNKVADMIRDQYKTATGNEFPIKDKE